MDPSPPRFRKRTHETFQRGTTFKRARQFPVDLKYATWGSTLSDLSILGPPRVCPLADLVLLLDRSVFQS
jgi:hypothetical protein